MNYTAIGDTVNLAQRLQDATLPGTILVSETVFHQTSMLFDFETVPSLQLKGIPQPVTGYRCLQAKMRPGSVRGIEGLRAPMIGRDSELRLLLESFADLEEQRTNRFTLITGEGGLGKSRLVAEMKACLADKAVTVLEGHSLTYRRSVSYWIFLDMLRNYLGATADTQPLEIQQRLGEKANQLLGSRAAESLPFLEHLLSLPLSDQGQSQRIEYLDASQLRQQIFRSVRELLLAEASRQPVLFIQDDLHWADDASLELLNYLVEATRSAPIYLLGVSRPFMGGMLQKTSEAASAALQARFLSCPCKVFHQIRVKNCSASSWRFRTCPKPCASRSWRGHQESPFTWKKSCAC
jgi:hypothetical protein